MLFLKKTLSEKKEIFEDVVFHNADSTVGETYSSLDNFVVYAQHMSKNLELSVPQFKEITEVTQAFISEALSLLDSFSHIAGDLFNIYGEPQYEKYGEDTIELFFDVSLVSHPQTFYALAFGIDKALSARAEELIERNIVFDANLSKEFIAELKQQIATAKEVLEKRYQYLAGLSTDARFALLSSRENG